MLALDDWEESSSGDEMHKLVLVRSGQIVLEGATGRWFILPGHLLFLPAARPYVFRTHKRTALIILYLNPAKTDWRHEGCWVTRSTPLATEMINHALSWSPDKVSDSEQACALIHAIRHLCRNWFSNPRILWLPTARSVVMRQVINLASRDLKGATVTALATAVGVSISTLQRHCKDDLGMSWRAFLGELRMTKAMELLVTSSLPISAIAAAVGFRNIGSFTAAFTRRVQMRPRDFARTYGTSYARNTPPNPTLQHHR